MLWWDGRECRGTAGPRRGAGRTDRRAQSSRGTLRIVLDAGAHGRYIPAATRRRRPGGRPSGPRGGRNPHHFPTPQGPRAHVRQRGPLGQPPFRVGDRCPDADAHWPDRAGAARRRPGRPPIPYRMLRHAPRTTSAHCARRTAPQRAAPERNRKRDGEVSVPLSEPINYRSRKGGYGSRQSAGDALANSCRAVGVKRRAAGRDRRPSSLPPVRDPPCRTSHRRQAGQRCDGANRPAFPTGRATRPPRAQLPYTDDRFATRRHPGEATAQAGAALRASFIHPHASREGRFRRCRSRIGSARVPGCHDRAHPIPLPGPQCHMPTKPLPLACGRKSCEGDAIDWDRTGRPAHNTSPFKRQHA